MPTSATATGCRPARSSRELPSEYFAENIYVTFQDDWSAFKHADDMNWHNLMWANDFPHSDSTWPWSQEMLVEHTATLTGEAEDSDPVRQRRRSLPHRHRRTRLIRTAEQPIKAFATPRACRNPGRHAITTDPTASG